MFKALLFLGAGSIIHAVHSNEMSAMGGLRKYMPITHVTFLIACLAIAGIPPFSGFFSKDEILTACFQFSPVVGWIMTGIAAMTAFYMFRLYFGIFWGCESHKQVSPSDANHAHHTPHESPLAMTFPLIFLAAVTCVSGFIPFGEFVSSNGQAYHIHLDMQVAITSIVIAVLSIGLATWMYMRPQQPVADMLEKKFKSLHTAAYRRFYMDEAWLFVTKKVIFRCISTPLAWWDRHVIDQFFNFTAWGTHAASEDIQDMQSGHVQQYAIWFLAGAIVLTIILLI
jgi:NADH-quinone oxidoreductase subunit L